MSARKADDSKLLASTSPSSQQCLTLAAGAVRIRKSGIEFRSEQPLEPWVEMTVSIQLPKETKKVNCRGVIVACNGNKRSGYQISMLFTDLSAQSQARLSSMVV
jgi:hypothetical protein